MILELADGRRLRVPDSMNEADAGALVKSLLAAEAGAKRGESAASINLASLRARLDELALAAEADQSSVRELLLRIARAVEGDRVLVADALGEFTRARVVPKGGV